MSTFNWDDTYKWLVSRTIQDGEHWIVKDDIRKRKNSVISIGILGQRRPITHWFAICIHKLDPSTNLQMRKICDNQQCIKPDHWVNISDKDDKYQWDHYNLMNNSVQDGDCRLWTGFIGPSGYGSATLNNKNNSAHLISFLVDKKLDEIPDGLVVRHKCVNKHCIAPEHLELGTYKENAQDKVRDQTLSIGSKHSNSTIDEIKAMDVYNSNDGIASAEDRAKRFNISVHIVRDIDRGKTWNHVTKLPRYQEKRTDITIDENTDKTFFLKKQEQIKGNSKEVYDEATGETHWIWSLTKDKGGYGRSRIGNKQTGSHIVSWIVFNMKPVPQGNIICHKCIKHPDCVNPDHLYAGTYLTNNLDIIKDGTVTLTTTMTKEKAEEIMTSKGNGTVSDRANRLNVSESIISHIDSGESWKSLREELNIPVTNKSGRISEQLAEQIMRSKGLSSERAKHFGVGYHTVHNIDMGRTWKKLREKLNLPIENEAPTKFKINIKENVINLESRIL